MKKFILIMLCFISFNFIKADIIVGDSTSSYILINCNTTTAQNLTIKYYFDSEELYSRIVLSPINEGNLYINKFLVCIDGYYYSKLNSTNIPASQWSRGFTGHKTTDNQEVWMTIEQPYINIISIQKNETPHIMFFKNDGELTGIDDINIYQDYEYYNLIGVKVDKNYEGFKIKKK